MGPRGWANRGSYGDHIGPHKVTVRDKLGRQEGNVGRGHAVVKLRPSGSNVGPCEGHVRSHRSHMNIMWKSHGGHIRIMLQSEGGSHESLVGLTWHRGNWGHVGALEVTWGTHENIWGPSRRHIKKSWEQLKTTWEITWGHRWGTWQSHEVTQRQDSQTETQKHRDTEREGLCIPVSADHGWVRAVFDSV